MKERYLFSDVVFNNDGTVLETIYRPDKTRQKEILYRNANDGISDGADRARTEKLFAADGETIEAIYEYKQRASCQPAGSNLVRMRYFKDVPAM